MIQRLTICALVLALTFSFAITSLAQQPSPTPPNSTPANSPPTRKPAPEDQQELIKVNVEEVQIPFGLDTIVSALIYSMSALTISL